MTVFLTEGAPVGFDASIPIWAVATVFVIENAVVWVGSFRWGWLVLSKLSWP